jgi:hypothetical protein
MGARVKFAKLNKRKDSTPTLLKSYFDGANKADSTQYKVVTLASVSGTKYEWRRFEKEWRQVLKKYGAPYLHVTDAISFKKGFRSGWNVRRRDALIMDCVKIIGRHIARPIRENDPGRLGLFPHSITIELGDFIKAREDKPEVPKNANEICVTQAVYDCMKWGFDGLGVQNIHLYFDQGESFRGHICDRVNNPEVSKDIPFLARITRIAEVDMRVTPALQFADLLGWCVSHKQDVRTRWHERLLKNPHEEYMVGYDQLMNPLPQAVELARKWKLPRRKLHP